MLQRFFFFAKGFFGLQSCWCLFVFFAKIFFWLQSSICGLQRIFLVCNHADVFLFSLQSCCSFFVFFVKMLFQLKCWLKATLLFFSSFQTWFLFCGFDQDNFFFAKLIFSLQSPYLLCNVNYNIFFTFTAYIIQIIFVRELLQLNFPPLYEHSMLNVFCVNPLQIQVVNFIMLKILRCIASLIKIWFFL